MRRCTQKLSVYSTSVPAVSEFWRTCVHTPTVAGPNTALAKINKVKLELQRAEDQSNLTTENFGGDSPNHASGSSAVVMSPHDAVLHASIAARLKTSPTAVGAPSASAPASHSSSSHILLPEFIYRRKTKEISLEADKVFHAYNEFYNHVKFRNGWEKPPIPKDAPLTEEMFHEAADIVARIRARLDEENPSTKLRQADGCAQIFLNSPEAVKLYNLAKDENEKNDAILAHAEKQESGGSKKNAFDLISQFHRREFVKVMVLNSFKDAMGFVEGLTKSKLERYFADVSDFGFNPSAHVQHLLLEMLSAAEIARLSFDVEDAVKYNHPAYEIVSTAATGDASSSSASASPSVSRRSLEKARQSRDNAHFCVEDGPEDKLWRDAIGKLYKAHDALLLAVAERKKNAIKRVPAMEKYSCAEQERRKSDARVTDQGNVTSPAEVQSPKNLPHDLMA